MLEGGAGRGVRTVRSRSVEAQGCWTRTRGNMASSTRKTISHVDPDTAVPLTVGVAFCVLLSWSPPLASYILCAKWLPSRRILV
jgi:hypothetical protein